MSKTRNKFSPEVRERAVRMVGEHRADYGSEWEAMTSIAGKIGCTAETPSIWLHDSIENASGKAGALHRIAYWSHRQKWKYIDDMGGCLLPLDQALNHIASNSLFWTGT